MLPSAVVFNPHKRLRFAKMDHGEDNEAGCSARLSKCALVGVPTALVRGAFVVSLAGRSEILRPSGHVSE